MHELLDRRPILHSRDFDETRAFLSARSTELSLPGSARERAAFDVRYNGVYLSSLWFGYIHYGAGIVSRASPARGEYWIHVPLRGRMTVAAHGTTTDCDPGLAALTSPMDVCVLRAQAQTDRLCVSIKGDALMRHLGTLLEDAPVEALRLAPSLRLEAGFGGHFARMLYRMANEHGAADSLPGTLAAGEFEQLVMTSVLLSQPHNYSSALRARQVRIAPRDVRRALDYIHEHAAEPIGLGDLVRASGVAGRTLLKHFREFHGVSPMRYVRNHRLLRARAELLGAGALAVSEVALHWGFTHLGRFAAEYRRRFGESPSSTRARARH